MIGRPPVRRLFPAGLAALVAAVGPGCVREPKSNLCPIQGRVFWNGQPAEKLEVSFHAVGFELPDPAPKSTAATDEIGAFHLIPGLPPGKYRIAIRKSGKKIKPGTTVAPVPDRYSDPAKSGIEVDIHPGGNPLPTFELTP